MTTSEYPSFKKIPRLNKPMVVTEKIDGTNGLVFVGEDGTVRAGSRNRWLDKGQPDNYGFRAWVEAHEDELRTLGPGYHYGEWWGQGINGNRYGLTEKRFSLFNVERYKDISPLCWSTVPVLGMYETFDTDLVRGHVETLRRLGSVAVPGCMRPEGVVVYHEGGGHLYKVLCENDSIPKGLVGATPDTQG